MRPLVVFAGVSGSGKSTLAASLADRLHVPLGEADELHPAANVAKMRSGHPLTDEDRAPWLLACADWLEAHLDSGGVLACSALRRRYRDVLRDRVPTLQVIVIEVPEGELWRRVAGRADHFMPVSLLGSQLATLEPLELDEAGGCVDGSLPHDQVVASALGLLVSGGGGRAALG